MEDTIDISEYAPALEQLAARHGITVTEAVGRILRHCIDREYEVFDWPPRPLIAPEPIEAIAPEARADGAAEPERMSA